MDVDKFTGQPPLDTNVLGHRGQALQRLQELERTSVQHATRVAEHQTQKRQDREEGQAPPTVTAAPSLDLQEWAAREDIEVGSPEDELRKRSRGDKERRITRFTSGRCGLMIPASTHRIGEVERRTQLLEAVRAVKRREYGRETERRREPRLEWGRYWMVSDVLASEYRVRRTAHAIRAADVEDRARLKEERKDADRDSV